MRRTTTGLVLTLPAMRGLVMRLSGSTVISNMMWVATEKRVAIMTLVQRLHTAVVARPSEIVRRLAGAPRPCLSLSISASPGPCRSSTSAGRRLRSIRSPFAAPRPGCADNLAGRRCTRSRCRTEGVPISWRCVPDGGFVCIEVKVRTSRFPDRLQMAGVSRLFRRALFCGRRRISPRVAAGRHRPGRRLYRPALRTRLAGRPELPGHPRSRDPARGAGARPGAGPPACPDAAFSPPSPPSAWRCSRILRSPPRCGRHCGSSDRRLRAPGGRLRLGTCRM